VTRLILQGSSTSQIAEHMTVSEHTVQQHLKSVFDKTGVRSRRDLVAKISHYEPRFRDNERRTSAHKPVRGGPKSKSEISPTATSAWWKSVCRWRLSGNRPVEDPRGPGKSRVAAATLDNDTRNGEATYIKMK